MLCLRFDSKLQLKVYWSPFTDRNKDQFFFFLFFTFFSPNIINTRTASWYYFIKAMTMTMNMSSKLTVKLFICCMINKGIETYCSVLFLYKFSNHCLWLHIWCGFLPMWTHKVLIFQRYKRQTNKLKTY